MQVRLLVLVWNTSLASAVQRTNFLRDGENEQIILGPAELCCCGLQMLLYDVTFAKNNDLAEKEITVLYSVS